MMELENQLDNEFGNQLELMFQVSKELSVEWEIQDLYVFISEPQ